MSSVEVISFNQSKNLANESFKQKNYSEAITIYEELLGELNRASAGVSSASDFDISFEQAKLCSNIAKANCALDKYEESFKYLAKCDEFLLEYKPKAQDLKVGKQKFTRSFSKTKQDVKGKNWNKYVKARLAHKYFFENGTVASALKQEVDNLPELMLGNDSNGVVGLVAAQHIGLGELVTLFCGPVKLGAKPKDFTEYSYCDIFPVPSDGSTSTDHGPMMNDGLPSVVRVPCQEKVSSGPEGQGFSRVAFVSVEPIDRGQEIFWDYGSHYVKNSHRYFFDARSCITYFQQQKISSIPDLKQQLYGLMRGVFCGREVFQQDCSDYKFSEFLFEFLTQSVVLINGSPSLFSYRPQGARLNLNTSNVQFFWGLYACLYKLNYIINTPIAFVSMLLSGVLTLEFLKQYYDLLGMYYKTKGVAAPFNAKSIAFFEQLDLTDPENIFCKLFSVSYSEDRGISIIREYILQDVIKQNNAAALLSFILSPEFLVDILTRLKVCLSLITDNEHKESLVEGFINNVIKDNIVRKMLLVTQPGGALFVLFAHPSYQCEYVFAQIPSVDQGEDIIKVQSLFRGKLSRNRTGRKKKSKEQSSSGKYSL